MLILREEPGSVAGQVTVNLIFVAAGFGADLSLGIRSSFFFLKGKPQWFVKPYREFFALRAMVGEGTGVCV